MTPYLGSGPYCYTHSLSMMFGLHSPSTTVIETVTGSPFGVQLVGGTMPFFDPYGWDPEVGLDLAVDLLGWRCERYDGGTPEEALARLRAACARGPVLAGPVDMGLLLYQPGSGAAGGGDHYVVVLSVDDDVVILHDPEGHPFATLPTAAFLASWRGEAVAYIKAPFVMRTNFVRENEVSATDAVWRCLPHADRWLAGRDDVEMPPGSLGGAAAVERLASQVAQGLDPDIRKLLAVFGVRVGVRRLGDAASCLRLVGLDEPSAIAVELARAVGGLQYPLVTGDDLALEAGLRRLAPKYEQLRDALRV